VKKVVKWVIAIAGVFVLLVTIGTLMGVAPSSTAAVDIEKAEELLQQSKTAGYITSFTCTGNEAEVTPQFWAGLNARAKKGLAMSLAAICDSQQSGNRITILDDQSGKTLASLSGSTYRVD
jgi:hypothetical protein